MHLLQEMVYIPSVFTISNVWNKKSIQERFICIYVGQIPALSLPGMRQIFIG